LLARVDILISINILWN